MGDLIYLVLKYFTCPALLIISFNFTGGGLQGQQATNTNPNGSGGAPNDYTTPSQLTSSGTYGNQSFTYQK